MGYWTNLANQARASDHYYPGNQWERMFRRHIETSFPTLAKSLGSELEAYCQVQTNDAMNLSITLHHQGTPADQADELALHGLMRRTPAEQDRTQPWEAEESEADQASAAARFLTLRR